MSYAQQRLWFLDQLQPGSAFYNISMGVRLEGALDIAALERSFAEVIRRHESLRTTFQIINELPVQIISPSQPLHLTAIDFRGFPEDERSERARQLVAEESQR